MNKVNINVDYSNMHQTFFKFKRKIEKVWNLNFNKHYKKFLNDINDELISSAGTVLSKLGRLQDANELDIYLNFEKWIRWENGFFAGNGTNYEKVIIHFAYKNNDCVHFITDNGHYDYANRIMFEYYFKNKNYDGEVKEFLSAYKSFIKNMKTDEIFYERSISFVSLNMQGKEERKIELGYNSALSSSDLQHDRAVILYENLLNFCEKVKQHQFFKMFSKTSSYKSHECFGLSLKFKVDVENKLTWCASFEKLYHEMYNTDTGLEIKSGYRSEDEISCFHIMQALSETGIYKGIDFTDMNEENWFQYAKMIDLMNY